MNAAGRWSEHLAAWAVPPHILAAAPEPPWGFPPALFARVAERALAGHDRGPSWHRAVEAVPEGGTVLDVGTGGGAAGLPLAPPAGLVVGVDESEAMLEAFSAAARRRGVAHRVVPGRWPDVAPAVEAADVVVCHHVFYNVADLEPFAAALTDRARRRVVVELTAVHPQSSLNRLWKAIHGVERPSRPTADDAVAVLTEMGLDVGREDSLRGPIWDEGHRAELVAFTRKRLCVGPDRDDEIDRLLGPTEGNPPTGLVTLWWEGTA